VKRAYRGQWADELKLPASGKWFVESHLATSGEKFAGRSFPNSTTELIEKHLDDSAAIMGVAKDTLYPAKWGWVRTWTPPEGGKAGQGSRGELKPSALEEMFVFNMMFAPGTQPPAGQKWLISVGDVHVVVVGGYEIGPSAQDRMGGLQVEAAYLLGIHSGGSAKLHGPLVDQSLKPGKVSCL